MNTINTTSCDLIMPEIMGNSCYTHENALKELCKLYGGKKRTAMEKTRFLSIKIGKKKSIAKFGARFLRQSQILKTTGGLRDFDSTIALRQAITGHKELSLAMIQPLMQGGLASTLVNYTI